MLPTPTIHGHYLRRRPNKLPSTASQELPMPTYMARAATTVQRPKLPSFSPVEAPALRLDEGAGVVEVPSGAIEGTEAPLHAHSSTNVCTVAQMKGDKSPFKPASSTVAQSEACPPAATIPPGFPTELPAPHMKQTGLPSSAVGIAVIMIGDIEGMSDGMSEGASEGGSLC